MACTCWSSSPPGAAAARRAAVGGGAGGRGRGGLVAFVVTAGRAAPVTVVGAALSGGAAAGRGAAAAVAVGSGTEAGAGTAAGGGAARTGTAIGAPDDRWASTMSVTPAPAMTARPAATTVRRSCRLGAGRDRADVGGNITAQSARDPSSVTPLLRFTGGLRLL